MPKTTRGVVVDSNVTVLQTQRYVSTDRDHGRERNFFLEGTTALLGIHGYPSTGGNACQRLEGAASSSRLEPDGMCRYSYRYTGMASFRYLYRYPGRRHVTRGSLSDT